MPRWTTVKFLSFVSALALSGPALLPASTAYAASKNEPMQVIGFWANDATSGLSGLYKYPKSITWFVPFWYSVNASGNLVNRVNTNILNQARAHHIPITPLVNDATGRQAFLTNSSARLNAARNIADMVKKEHFQGVSIDFEPPHTLVAKDLDAFTMALRDYLPHGSVITMSVVPHSGGAYDWSKLDPEVNQFVLMSYDQHDDGSYAGPVAATPWVQRILTRMEKTVPPQKILLGVALYGYTWHAGSTSATTVPFNAVSPTMRSHAKWDTADQETYSVYNGAGGKTFAWWESLQGMNQKIHLAKRDHVAGIALWHLGYANNSVYQLLLHQVGKQP